VLVTGGASPLGAAVVRRLLSDARFEVRVFDQRPAPQWMRESCEIRTGDPRSLADAREASASCQQVILAGAIAEGADAIGRLPYTVAELDAAFTTSGIRAALDHAVERLVFVSSAHVFERAAVFPTPEEHLENCPAPRSAYGRGKLAGEALCRAAHEESGLSYTVCRPFDPYGPRAEGGGPDLVGDLLAQAVAGAGELSLPGPPESTRTPTHVDDVAEGIVGAMASPAAAGEDFNLAGPDELTLAQLADLAWKAAGRKGRARVRSVGETLPVMGRRYGSAEKARRLLGWKATTGLQEGLAAAASRLREHPVAAPEPALSGR
jgi:nucleoside-diphosphate-sugar epimerase